MSFHWHRTFYSHGDLKACLSSLIRRTMHSLRSKYPSESWSHPHRAAHSTCAITAYGNLPGAPPLTAGRHQVSTNLPGGWYWGRASCPSCWGSLGFPSSLLALWEGRPCQNGHALSPVPEKQSSDPKPGLMGNKVKSLGLPVQAPATQGALGGMAGLKKKSSHSQSCHLQVHTAED